LPPSRGVPALRGHRDRSLRSSATTAARAYAAPKQDTRAAHHPPPASTRVHCPDYLLRRPRDAITCSHSATVGYRHAGDGSRSYRNDRVGNDCDTTGVEPTSPGQFKNSRGGYFRSSRSIPDPARWLASVTRQNRFEEHLRYSRSRVTLTGLSAHQRRQPQGGRASPTTLPQAHRGTACPVPLSCRSSSNRWPLGDDFLLDQLAISLEHSELAELVPARALKVTREHSPRPTATLRHLTIEGGGAASEARHYPS